MKSLKNHISVIIPLFILLFSFQFVIIMDRVVENYQYKLFNDYSIVITSVGEINKERLKDAIPQIKSIEPISPNNILKEFKGNFSPANLAYLKSSLPKFYNVKLNIPPDKGELNEIKEKIKEIPNVSKVETFEKSYTKIYNLLLLVKKLSEVFATLIFIISVLLIFKQMEIWTLQHQERMYIMGLFGSPFWMKSAVLYKLVFTDSLISAITVSLIYYFLPKNASFQEEMRSLGIDFNFFKPIDDTSILILLSIVITIISVTIVILKQKTEIK